MRLTGLAPVVSGQARLLVLGSFPGARSLAQQQYYGHPQNHFWKILSALWGMDLAALDYPARIAALRERGLALWDVYAACEREGSLDAAIRNAEVNDFAALARHCPRLEAVAHNGGESFRHAPAVIAALGAEAGRIQVYKLPSTSPANASWSFERKRGAWEAVLRRHHLL
ncbi:DNA-deoxyinosine glycosylase [Xylophilus sp. ASV27]|uniref:DNA-deoxyinosine glycosylase n=1 Tax=Xylophilus sp. ASV27 TaxID=2795129 RepID=UPI0018EB17AB|nr:DNA-deoxyinosine glycosylase [Xylophilus sp. ASV27]